jgi:hypothetical protein
MRMSLITSGLQLRAGDEGSPGDPDHARRDREEHAHAGKG